MRGRVRGYSEDPSIPGRDWAMGSWGGGEGVVWFTLFKHDHPLSTCVGRGCPRGAESQAGRPTPGDEPELGVGVGGVGAVGWRYRTAVSSMGEGPKRLLSLSPG